MYLLIMVLDDQTRLHEVLEAWQNAGVLGITILESTGLNRVLQRHKAHSMFIGFEQVFGSSRVGHHTLLAVIDSMDLAEAAAAATEGVLGSLDKPHTGLIFALPVSKTWGLPEPYAAAEEPGRKR